ncbi:MAG: NADH-quinone oxidoreductase subunit J [Syntrophomonadaceae bacterium]|nr:NADH-quinone oxidoreductase subunit J [Syntrophomonadaceae bacterium]
MSTAAANLQLQDAVFVMIAIVTTGAALGVVFLRNIVHNALCLVLTFLGVAAVYFQLNAGFIGLVQILVYAGAISVLIIFAIMLVMDKEINQTNLPIPSLGRRIAGVYITALLVITLVLAIYFTAWPLATGAGAPFDAVGMLAELMLGDYVIAFEAAAVLLLVAVVGAVILAKGVEKQ